jgi:hypothetical protein
MVRRMNSISFVNDTQTKSDRDYLFLSNWSFEKYGALSTRLRRSLASLTGWPWDWLMLVGCEGAVLG